MQMNLRAGLALAAILGLLLAPTALATDDRAEAPGLFSSLDLVFEWIAGGLQSLEALIGAPPPPTDETTTEDPPPPDGDPPTDPDDEKGPVTDPGGSPTGGG